VSQYSASGIAPRGTLKPTTYVRYGCCFVCIVTRSFTGVFVATTTASHVTVRPWAVVTTAGRPPLISAACVSL
jgi:hypothetical protein